MFSSSIFLEHLDAITVPELPSKSWSKGARSLLFVERPITVGHVRQFCSEYSEGLRVEYKSTFDASVRSQLPKVVSSFANSLGGVLIIGVNAVNGIPQPHVEGFAPAPSEELALTVENICLAGIHPPILPSITVVPSDVPGHSFLLLEIEESGQAPHAIENSRKIYVRTGNAANQYDLANVDAIVALLKRRQEPIEFRARLIADAEQRSLQVSLHDKPELRATICPTYPRSALCSSKDVWDFLVERQPHFTNLVPYNSLRRVPDGAASLTPTNPRHTPQYSEVSRYGLQFATKEFTVRPFRDTGVQQLHFGDLVHTLRSLLVCSELFFSARGYRGQVTISASLRGVRGQVMTFRDEREAFFLGEDSPADFRSYTDSVSAERLVEAQRNSGQRLDLIADILRELTWPFWQGNGDYPRGELEGSLRRYLP
jgi:Schlafen, AlbA_2